MQMGWFDCAACSKHVNKLVKMVAVEGHHVGCLVLFEAGVESTLIVSI